MEDITFLGVREDDRPQEVKDKDPHFFEMVAKAAPVNWVEKNDAQIRKFTDRDQDGSYSCVAQTTAKLAEVLYYLKSGEKVVFSATPIYANRSNKPQEGMIPADALNIWKNTGITLEQILPSQNINEVQINNMPISNLAKDTAKMFCIDDFAQLPVDIDTIAGTIQETGKAVAILTRFTAQEWASAYPVILGSATPLGHEIAAVDFTLYNGKKCLVIEDSAHFGGLTRRYISEDWMSRIYSAYYPIAFKNIEQDRPANKPQYTFTKQLHFIGLDMFGNISDTLANALQKDDVIALQNILKYEGFFPTNIQSTGYYGAISCRAVLAWQIKHNVAPLDELNALQGKNIGPKTIAVLNSLYGS